MRRGWHARIDAGTAPHGARLGCASFLLSLHLFINLPRKTHPKICTHHGIAPSAALVHVLSTVFATL